MHTISAKGQIKKSECSFLFNKKSRESLLYRLQLKRFYIVIQLTKIMKKPPKMYCAQRFYLILKFPRKKVVWSIYQKQKKTNLYPIQIIVKSTVLSSSDILGSGILFFCYGHKKHF